MTESSRDNERLQQQLRALQARNSELEEQNRALRERISVKQRNERRFETLRTSEQMLRSIADNSSDHILVVDPELKICFVNRADRSRNEMIGRDVATFVPPEYRQLVRESFKRVIATGQPTQYQTAYRSPDSIDPELRYFDVRLSAIIEDGEVVSVVCSSYEVTEREVVQQRLKESQERLQLANRVAGIGCFDMRPLDDQLFWDRKMHEIYGLDPGSTVDRRAYFERVIHPDDRQRVLAEFAASMADGQSSTEYYSEFRIEPGSGQLRYVEIRALHHRNDRGAVDRIIGTCLDITERKLAELALRQSERRFTQLVTQTEQIVFMIGSDGTFQLSEGRGLKALGLEPGAVVGQSAFDVYADNPEMLTQIRRALAGEALEGVARVAGLVFRTWYTPYLDNEGELAGLMGLAVNITEEKRALEALRKSEALLAETGRMAKVGGWEVRDLQPNWTEETYRIHELDPAIKPPIEKAFTFYHPDDVPVLRQAFSNALEQAEPYDLELRLTTATGRPLWVRTQCNPVVVDGEVVLLRGAIQDITERKTAQIELEQHRERLEQLIETRTAELRDKAKQLAQANADLESFSHSVSHDLQAPLRAISGFTRALLEDYASELDDGANRLGAIIQNNVIKMERLIHDLLDFSRSTRLPMSLVDVDMRKLVGVVFDEATTPEVRQRVQFSVGELPAVQVDHGLLRQVWVNLIGNALKFSSGRDPATIKISGWREESRLVYRIEDNGAGFDPAYKHKLFGVFQRLHSQSEFEGTGVGLALVQRIVRRHGGEVGAEGQENRGAAFWFSLPDHG